MSVNLPQAEAKRLAASWSRQDWICLVLGLGIAAATFAVDLSTPRGVAAGVFPHFLAIGVATWSTRRWMPFGLALLASTFTLVGFALTEGGRFDIILVNRLFLVAAYWLVAFLVFQKQSLDLRLRQSLVARVAGTDQRSRELAQGESRLRLITDRLPALVAYVGADERYRFANKAYEELVEVPVERIVGRRVSDILGAPAYRVVKENINRVLAGEIVRTAVDLPTESGIRNFRVSYLPDRDQDGAVAGFVLLAVDVSEELALQQQLQQTQKLEAIGQLSGGIAHDFNNLLGVITGNIEMAALHAGPEERHYLDAAQRAADRGVALIFRLLTFARRQPMHPAPTDVAAVVGSMEELLERSLGEQVRVRVSAPDSLWTAMVDAHQLEAAVLNLALNARDAMPEGGMLVLEMQNLTPREQRAPGGPALAPGDYVVLSVSDNGTGMTAEVLEHAFEPFFTTKDVGKGSGLGLPMVYGFARQSGGTVTIDSEVGVGTTVRLYLPRAAAGSVAAEADSVVDGKLQPIEEGLAVLLVEDDPAMQSVATAMLEQLNCEVESCNSAEQALEILGRRRFDLLLTDIVLADGPSGYEVALKAKERSPGLTVVFMSGYAESAAVHHGRLAAGRELLEKPFKLHQLAVAIERARRTAAE